MCTVSWLHEEGGYQLFCNRDELRSRGIALPPGMSRAGGVRYLAPRDADHGGTWVAASEAGLTLCLLNGNKGLAWPATRSRGLLLPDLIGCGSAAAVGREMDRERLQRYAPFTLLALDGTDAVLAEWDGADLLLRAVAARAGLLSSSSVDAAGAERVRRAQFDQLVQSGTLSPESLRKLHESHGGGASAYSPCMHREDAETVSFTHVAAGPGRIRMSYSPGAPCLQVEAVLWELTYV